MIFFLVFDGTRTVSREQHEAVGNTCLDGSNLTYILYFRKSLISFGWIFGVNNSSTWMNLRQIIIDNRVADWRTVCFIDGFLGWYVLHTTYTIKLALLPLSNILLLALNYHHLSCCHFVVELTIICNLLR